MTELTAARKAFFRIIVNPFSLAKRASAGMVVKFVLVAVWVLLYGIREVVTAHKHLVQSWVESILITNGWAQVCTQSPLNKKEWVKFDRESLELDIFKRRVRSFRNRKRWAMVVEFVLKSSWNPHFDHELGEFTDVCKLFISKLRVPFNREMGDREFILIANCVTSPWLIIPSKLCECISILQLANSVLLVNLWRLVNSALQRLKYVRGGIVRNSGCSKTVYDKPSWKPEKESHHRWAWRRLK